MRTTFPKAFLAPLATFLLAAPLPGAEPKPQIADLKPEILKFDPFTWPSEIPNACPFERSKAFNAIRFLGVKSGFRYGDTWYPTWAENDILYSPWTDGKTKRLDGYTDWSQSWVHPEHITTGQGVILGDDPLSLVAYSIGLDKSSPATPYAGRYPCGSLVHDGVWYYGTYCLGPGDGGFAALYLILPARRIPLRAALAGGVFAALAFEGGKRAFILYATHAPIYRHVYGALAVVPLFLVWIYVSWVIVLAGAAVVAVLAEGPARRPRRGT